MKNIFEEIKKAFSSKLLSIVLSLLGVFLLVMLVFSAGVSVGFNKASYGRAWGEHYQENFGGGRFGLQANDLGRMGMMDDFTNPHGTAGKIIKIELPNILVSDEDGTEKTIVITDDTNIRKTSTNILATDLLVDDFVVVVGSPNLRGVIEAKMLRVLPSPDLLNN